MPVLSVVIPVYNGQDYIDNILKNFDDAFGGEDIELIFVNDGSTDETRQILDREQAKHPYTVKVINKENAGVSAARNTGMQSAAGEYISFVDCDDAITKDYLSFFTQIPKPFDLVVFQQIRVNQVLEGQEDKHANPVEQVTNSDMLNRMVVNPTAYGVYNLFINTGHLKRTGISFKEGYKYYEDYDFLYRLFAQTKQILVTEHQLYYYVLRENSAMQRFTKDRLSCISLMEDLKSVFKEYVPDFSDVYEKYGVNRIYWSLMWQASIAYKTDDAKKFAKDLNMRERMRSLKDFPGNKVKLSARLFLISKTAFILAAKIAGHKKTKIQRTAYAKTEE